MMTDMGRVTDRTEAVKALMELNDRKKTSISFMAFRIVLSAVFLLTALGTSHGIRYVLLGILLIMVVAERLHSRYRRNTR